MEKLNFIFKSGEEELYNEATEYRVLNDHIVFKIDKYLIKIRPFENFHFVKSGDGSVFTLTKECGIMKCFWKVEVNGKQAEYEIGIEKFECKKTEDGFIIKYLLESDEKLEKCIIISID